MLRFQILLICSKFAFCFCYRYTHRLDDSSFIENPICPNIILKNGFFQKRFDGYLAVYGCNEGYQLEGQKYSICGNGKWDNQVPFCIKSGCPKLQRPSNGYILFENKRTIAKLCCKFGYEESGPLKSLCDGQNWVPQLGDCHLRAKTNNLKCGFETASICGWQNKPKALYKWRRSDGSSHFQGDKSSPEYDHTTQKTFNGYFVMIDSYKMPTNYTASLVSPFYDHNQNYSCFSFWYYMHNNLNGQLQIYVKTISDENSNLQPYFVKCGDQGNRWKEGVFNLPNLVEDYQIIIEGTAGQPFRSGIALDDVQLLTQSECISRQHTTIVYNRNMDIKRP